MNLLFEVILPNLASPKLYPFSKNKILIGRTPDNDLQIDDLSVSRNHAVIYADKDIWYLEDCGSKNGTYTNSTSGWQKINGRGAITFPALLRIGNSISLRITINFDTILDQQKKFSSVDSSVVENIDGVEAFEAIMVLDMCKSTEIANEDEKISYHLKKRLNKISKSILFENNVNFLQSTGDGFLATFIDLQNALKSALEIMSKLKQRNKSSSNPEINIRIAIHAGKIYKSDSYGKDIQGNDVNIAFRIEGLQSESFKKLEIELPKINRIFCTSDYHQAIANNDISKKVKFKKCGSAVLKGIKEPKEIILVSGT